MRSALFDSYPTLKKEFLEHLSELWKLEPDHRSALVPFVLEYVAANTNRETEDIRSRAAAAVAAPADVVLKALSVLSYIAANWNPVTDRAEDCVFDMLSLGFVPEAESETVRGFLDGFFKAVESTKEERMRRIFSHSLLPSFNSVTTLVDMRAVFANPFGATMNDDPTTHDPKWIGWEPVVLLKVARNGGDPETTEFQCTEAELNTLIDHLIAARKELHVASAQLTKFVKAAPDSVSSTG